MVFTHSLDEIMGKLFPGDINGPDVVLKCLMPYSLQQVGLPKTWPGIDKKRVVALVDCFAGCAQGSGMCQAVARSYYKIVKSVSGIKSIQGSNIIGVFSMVVTAGATPLNLKTHTDAMMR